ncbi:MAG TPA: hypothetical protein VFK11_02260 [Candidatus Saccharimonadales bacterium]|nr:hypothetical protein [Candidatus Saccharimonadales bacterium]
MLVASPEFKDLDLPVFDEATELVWAQDLFNANNADAGPKRNQAFPDRVIRPLQMVIDDTQLLKNGLMDILRRTDEELGVVAEMCGASVVGHEWGLYPAPPHATQYDGFRPVPPELLPEDKILVAIVDVIRGTKDILPPGLNIAEGTEHWYAPTDVYGRITQGITHYYDGDRPHKHTDIRDDQFVVGTCPQATGSLEHTWLVDIEPVF